jgi:hypothetical protein
MARIIRFNGTEMAHLKIYFNTSFTSYMNKVPAYNYYRLPYMNKVPAYNYYRLPYMNKVPAYNYYRLPYNPTT